MKPNREDSESQRWTHLCSSYIVVDHNQVPLIQLFPTCGASNYRVKWEMLTKGRLGVRGIIEVALGFLVTVVLFPLIFWIYLISHEAAGELMGTVCTLQLEKVGDIEQAHTGHAHSKVARLHQQPQEFKV
eukprot:2106214-Amphidinium_carterae.2